MKRVSILLLLLLTVCLLAACSAHDHQYSEEWSADSVGHWYDALCDCEDAEIHKENHVDEANDGTCDICGFTDHAHTYSSKWLTDDEYHWNAADCGHKVEGNRGKHEDKNIDGLCDTCLMVMGDKNHKHSFETDYSSDGTHHWKAATCEHIGAAVKEPHTNIAGICTVCGFGTDNIDTDNVAAILAASVAQRKLISSGSMLHTTGGQLTPITERVSYVLGKNATNISSQSTVKNGSNTFDTYTDTWLEQNGDRVFAVQTVRELKNGAVNGSDGTKLEVVAMTPERLMGPYIPHSTLGIEDSEAYAIETVLNALYALSQSEMSRNVNISSDKSARKVTFDFGYIVLQELSVGENPGGTQTGENDNDGSEVSTVYQCKYFTISGYFIYSESFAMTEAKLTVNSYTDQTLDESVNGDGKIKPDITYDHTTGEVTFTADAIPDTYEVFVTQTEGDRTYTSKYPEAELIPTQFELEYNGAVLGDSVNLPTGSVILSFGSMIPASADSKFIDESKISCELINNSTGEPVFFGAMLINGAFSLYIPTEGSFTLEYTYNGTKKSCQITALSPVPKSIDTFVLHKVYDMSGTSSWNEVSTKIEDDPLSGAQATYTVSVGETLYFIPKAVPFLADQGYTYTFSSTTATIETTALTRVMVFGEIMDSYDFLAFTATAAGTYVINYTSTADTSITGTFIITVK